MSTLLLQFIAGSLLFLTACQKKAEGTAPDSRISGSNPGSIKAPEDDLIATFQSIGREQRATRTNLTAFLDIAALPETHEVVTGLMGKVTALLSRSSISSNLVASIGTSELAAVLETMIEFDSIGELRQSQGRSLNGAVALRMSDEEHSSFTNRLTQSNGNPAGGGIAVARNGNWTLVTLGMVSSGTNSSNIERLLGQREMFGRSTNWLDLTADLQKLGSTWFTSKGSVSNHLHLTVAPQNDAFRTEIHLTSDRPLNLELGTWNVPTNTIRDPLIGFTAVQGVGGWIQEQPASRTIGLTNAANQVFLWSQSLSPFSVSAATASEAPIEIVSAVAEKLLPTLKPVLAPLNAGTFQMFTNEAVLIWQGLPMVVPFLRPAPAPEGNFIFGGLFPLANPGTNAPPPELIAQVTSRTNLVYYDWEITRDRINQWRQISQIISIVKNEFSGDTNLLSERWLNRIQAQLGNCVTEVSLTNPRELTFLRRGAIGLSSIELVSLARWLDPAYVPKPRGKKSPPTAAPLTPAP